MKPRRLSYVLLILAALLLTGFMVVTAGAQSGDFTEKYRDVKEQIKEGESKLQQAKKAEDITLAELERTNRLLAEISKELRSYQTRLEKTRRNAEKTKAEADALENKITSRKEWITRKLRAMQRYGQYGDTLLVLGSSEDLPQFLRRWHYLEVLAELEKTEIDELRKDVAKLNDKRAELVQLATRLQKEEKEVAASQAKLKRQKDERESMLAMVRQKQENYERMLRELRKSAARMQKLISESPSGLNYSGKGFRRLKGHLPWPVQGRIAIPYGSQKDPEFNTPVFRNGVYIGTSSNAVVQAVSGGRVVYADWFKGYGQLVIINHGEGYHSLYGNLSEIFLKAGDIINKDANIGRVGTSGMLDRPSLYFEVRYKGRPLDPSHWLARK